MSSAQRFAMMKTSDTPGPQQYQQTAMTKNESLISATESARVLNFGTKEKRFVKSEIKVSGPGPGAYDQR